MMIGYRFVRRWDGTISIDIEPAECPVCGGDGKFDENRPWTLDTKCNYCEGSGTITGGKALARHLEKNAWRSAKRVSEGRDTALIAFGHYQALTEEILTKLIPMEEKR